MQPKKRVLIITYYWPPQGGSGVQRWLKFSKYFREFGWEPIIYTPSNPEMMSVDSSLEQEISADLTVIKRGIIEPYSLYKLFVGKRKEPLKPGFIRGAKSEKNSFKERASLFIRSNLFIPDPKMLWIAPSIRFLTKYISYNRVDAIVTTGPPHSMHLIGYKLSKKNSLPWIADFRDPWSTMFNFKYLNHLASVVALHKRLEKRVLTSATAVVTVSQTIAKELSTIAGGRDIKVITNGYDGEDFSLPPPPTDKKFSITYTGLFMEGQNPKNLWRYLGERVKSDHHFAADLQINLIGNIDSAILESLTENRLTPNAVLKGYLPHNEAILFQRSSQLLLLSAGVEPEAAGILTGKYFEYVASKRPILAFAPLNSELHRAIEQDKSGAVFHYSQESELHEWLDKCYIEFKTAGCCNNSNSREGLITKYSRKELAKEMVTLLDTIL